MENANNDADVGEATAVEDWLRVLADERRLSRAGMKVVQAVIEDPRASCYASASEMGERVGVNVATVVRAAQALGYEGWPGLRDELRARYIETLSAVELSDVHRSEAPEGDAVGQALDRNVSQLADLRRRFDRTALQSFARSFAIAKRRLIVASGTYAAVGHVLAHHATLAGYRAELVDDAVALSNSTGDLGSGDILVALGFWRIYKSTVTAMREAKSKGAKVCLITDVKRPYLVGLADQVIVIPSEGTSFFVSVVPAMAIVECACAELGRLDPSHTAGSISAFEEQWDRYGHLVAERS